MENNYLYLVWKSPLSGKRYIIGRLNRAEEYSFEYSNECSMARKDGWEMLPSFPESKKYYSKDLFPAFSSRLPDRKRRNINQVLKKYGLNEYDGYEILKKSGGRLPIDSYSFEESDYVEKVTGE